MASSQCTQSRAEAGSPLCALAPERNGTTDTWLIFCGLDFWASRVAAVELRILLSLRRFAMMLRRPKCCQMYRETCFAGPLRSRTQNSSAHGRSCCESEAQLRGKRRTACMKHPLQVKKCSKHCAFLFARKCFSKRRHDAHHQPVTLSHKPLKCRRSATSVRRSA
jgi:hypothetical protein